MSSKNSLIYDLSKHEENSINNRVQKILTDADVSEFDDYEIQTINRFKIICYDLNEKLSKRHSVKRTNKNISGYNLFGKEMFPEITAQYPNLEQKEKLKKVAELWKGSPANIREDYNKRAKLVKPADREMKLAKKQESRERSSSLKKISQHPHSPLTTQNLGKLPHNDVKGSKSKSTDSNGSTGSKSAKRSREIAKMLKGHQKDMEKRQDYNVD